jgi:hypothetical protein
MKKLISILLISIMLSMSGCIQNLINNKTYVTEDGDVLSNPLTYTLNYLLVVKGLYEDIRRITNTAYDASLITSKQYYSIVEIADEFKQKYDKVKDEVIKWYQLEDNLQFINKSHAEKSISELTKISLKLANSLTQFEGIDKDDVAYIKITIMTVNKMYLGGSQ